MNKVVVGLLVSLILVGCSNLGTIRAVNGNKVQNIEDPNDYGSIAYVDYFDVDTLKKNEIKRAVITMGYLFFSKINLTVCLVHINSDKMVNRQGNLIIYLMFVAFMGKLEEMQIVCIICLGNYRSMFSKFVC